MAAAQKYRILIPCAFPYYPMVMAHAFNVIGHEVHVHPHLLLPNRSPEDDENFFKEIDQLLPHFVFCFNDDLINPCNLISQKFVDYCDRKRIPIVSFVADHPGLGTWLPTFELLKNERKRELVRFFTVAQGWIKEFTSRNLLAKKTFMPTNPFLEEQIKDRAIVRDLAYSGTPYPQCELTSPTPVLMEDPGEAGLTLIQRDFFLSTIEKELRAHRLDIQSAPLQGFKELADAYFGESILSNEDFELAHTRSLELAQNRLAPAYFELWQKSFRFLSYAHSYSKTVSLLRSLIPQGLKIFGPDWDRSLYLSGDYISRYPSRLEYYELCQTSRIYFCHQKDQLMDGLNERVFIGALLGGFVLTDHRPDLDKLFDGEIKSYRSSEEARDLIRYYLAHESERSQLARAAREKCMNHYTSVHWAREVIRCIENEWQLV